MLMFGLGRDLRHAITSTWDDIVDAGSLWALPDILHQRYNQTYREIIGQLIYFHSTNDRDITTSFWRYLSLDYHTHALSMNHHVTPEDVLTAAKHGSIIAQAILDSYGGDSSTFMCNDDTFDILIGESVWNVFGSLEIFAEIDKLMKDELVIPEEYVADVFIVVNKAYTKAYLTDDWERL